MTAELIEYQKQLKGRKGDKNKFVREQLEALDPFFTKFFFDIDKSGKVTAKVLLNHYRKSPTYMVILIK